MKSRMMISLLVIALVAAVIGGGTMAIFTDNAALGEAEFVAGTVKVSAGGEGKKENWNPGDDGNFKFCIENEGSKDAYVRSSWKMGWYPGPWRILVLWNGAEIQLVGIDWDSFCKDCIITEGPIATAVATYGYEGYELIGGQGFLIGDSTFTTEFQGLTFTADVAASEGWLMDGVSYDSWCLDSTVFIGPAGTSWTYNVEIYDPFCNPDWYKELGLEAGNPLYDRFSAINFKAINYIFSHNMMARGYNSTEIQQAIWVYTNGSVLNRFDFTGGIPGGEEIVDYVNANLGFINGQLVDAFITVAVDDTGWEKVGDYYYYTFVLPGTASEPSAEGRTVCISGTIELDLATPNEYQGMEYRITTWVEAIQSSNEAYGDDSLGWGWSPGN